ncbi:ATP-binding protein [Vibrio nomapromontoriensis]|uniref:ATP-binding protein n=1 Tax=Vibrio nomapromontoriensis TaxID=2910246 RepID=UPI003D0C90FC
MTRDGHIFSNTYQSAIDVSRVAAEDLKGFWYSRSINENTISELELCVVELVNNAYEHAYASQDGEPIEVLSRYNENKVIVDITHFGDGMSQAEFRSALEADFIEPDPDDPDTWTTSGRGFIILAALLDDVELTQEGDKNTFTLIKTVQS